MIMRVTCAILILVLFAACNTTTEPNDNPNQPLGGPFSEKPSVGTDNNGNFMAVWKDGASLWSKYYPNGLGQTPFRVELGNSPEFDMDINGNAFLVYHREEVDNRRITNSFLKVFDASTQTWQAENRFIMKPERHHFSPKIAVHDNLAVMLSRAGNIGSDITQPTGVSQVNYETNLTSPLYYDGSPLANGWNRSIYQPTIAAASNNQAIMTWSQDTPQGLYIAYLSYNSRNPGSSFWTPSDLAFQSSIGIQISSGKVVQGNYKLVMTDDGDAALAWLEQHPNSPNASSLKVAMYSVQTNEWTSTRIETASLVDDAAFDVSIDREGSIFLVWENSISGLNRRIYDSTTEAWLPEENIFSAGNYQDLRVKQTDSGNGALVFSVNDEIYLSSYDKSIDNWSTPDLIGNGESPDIAIDDNGECLAVWQKDGFLFEYQCSHLSLDVSITDDVGGKITSSPVGIECGFLLGQETTKCSARFQPNQMVTLIPNPDSNFVFAQWGGDCSAAPSGSETNSVIVTMDSAKSCEANFTSTTTTTALLTSSKSGNGDGLIRSDLPGIDCGLNCGAAFDLGTTVTLVALADAESNFRSWSGTGNCASPDSIVNESITVTLTENSNCLATFNKKQFALSVTKSGAGDGDIVSDITAVNCGSDCDETLDINTTVVLTATADMNSVFSGWSGTGDCLNPTQVQSNQLTLDLTQDSECVATFDPVSSNTTILTVILNGGPGAGEVNSDELPIPLLQCVNSSETSSTCSVTYPLDSSVTLTAIPFSPKNTVSSSGCDSLVGTNRDCLVVLNQNKTVTFDFSESPEYEISATVTGNGSIITFGAGEGITGNITCPSINCSDIFTVEPGGPTAIAFEAHPDVGSTFFGWGANQCDVERVINGIGVCSIDLIPGSPSVRQVDATFQ